MIACGNVIVILLVHVWLRAFVWLYIF